MSVATRSRHAGLLIWIAYLVIPTDAGGLIHGIPLGPIDAIALLTIAWLAANGVRLPGAAIVAAVLGITVAAAAAIPGTSGFRARYFVNASATGPHERSTEYPDSPYTRVDDRLDFAPGGQEFPLAFFNDNGRFNFYRPNEPHRRKLEFAVRWSGLWWVSAGTHAIYLDAPQSTAQVFVDGGNVVSVSPETGAGSKDTFLTAGWHRLDVVFSSPYGAPRRFSVGELRDGQSKPFDSTSVMTQQIRGWQMTGNGVLRVVKTGADAVALACLAWLFAVSLRPRLAALRQEAPARVRRLQVLGLLAVVGAVEALVFAWPWSRQVMLLTGGDDPMTYEGYARDILLNGLLMNGGLPLGQGEPFYYQAFYPYFLAAVHALFGEGMFGVMLVQRLLVVLTIWMLVEITVALSGDEVWPAALGCATFFAGWKFWPIAADLLNESLYVPLLVAWTVSLIKSCRAPTTARAIGAGLLGGFTAITRSTALLAWPAVFPACWMAWKAAANRRVLLGALVLCSFGVFSLITVRNWIVAGQFAPTSTELGVTLLGGNELPAGVTIDLSARGALYERLRFNAFTAQVIEYAITAPRLFALNLGRKALFVLGFFEPYAPGWGYSPVYIAVWVTAAAGLIFAIRTGQTPMIPLILPALVAITQFAALVVVYPKGERLILPVHTLLVPYSAIAIYRMARAMVQNSSDS
jgi:hypothetical protein